MISTFVGAFIFAVLGIVGLTTGLYDDGPFVLFLISLGVLAVVIASLVTWIGRLSSIGGVAEAVDLVADATRKAFAETAAAPTFGGWPLVAAPAGGHMLHLPAFGFFQQVDGKALQAVAEQTDVDVFLLVRPGSFVDPTRPVLTTSAPLGTKATAAARRAFLLGPCRTFEQDPRFGVVVLSEIASRARSPGVNDPGTAIDVVHALTGVLAGWRREVAAAAPAAVVHARLRAPDLAPVDVIDDAFRAIGRDGAGRVEVVVKVQKALATLAALDPDAFGRPARAMADAAAERAQRALTAADDVAALVAARAGVGWGG